MCTTYLSWYTRKQSGFIVLVSVLGITIVGVSLVSSMLFLQASTSKTTFALEQSGNAKDLANACVEETFRQIKRTSDFSGTGILSLAEGTCTYTVVIGIGENRLIQATGTAGTVVRKVKVMIDALVPRIHIASWEEVGDF